MFSCACGRQTSSNNAQPSLADEHPPRHLYVNIPLSIDDDGQRCSRWRPEMARRRSRRHTMNDPPSFSRLIVLHPQPPPSQLQPQPETSHNPTRCCNLWTIWAQQPQTLQTGGLQIAEMPPSSYYPDPPNDLTGGLPINLDSLRDGRPGTKPFYPYSTLIRCVRGIQWLMSYVLHPCCEQIRYQGVSKPEAIVGGYLLRHRKQSACTI